MSADTIPAEVRAGDWMQTATGRQFWPVDPRAEEVDIRDIAHALAMQCRFAGHCQRFYSVAEHSVLLSLAVAPEHALWALLHDASEAYLVDVPRPLKPYLPGYREAENAVMAAICERFGLPAEMPRDVKIADGRILADEAAQNMAAPHVPWNDTGAPLGVRLRFWSPEDAKAEFLGRYIALLPEVPDRSTRSAEPAPEVEVGDGLLADTGCTSLDDLRDKAAIGVSLMERIADLCKPGSRHEHWAPADDPAEIVFDLANEADELRRERDEAVRVAVEDERDRLLAEVVKPHGGLVVMDARTDAWAGTTRFWLEDKGAMLPADRARLRADQRAGDGGEA